MTLMVPQDAVVTDVKQESADTRTLTLALTDPQAEMRFTPGQFNMLGLAGFGEVPLTFTELARGREFAHTVRGIGRVTKALLKVKPGEHVQVRGPFGSQWPWEGLAGKDVIVVAGGAGIVPLRPFLQRVFANRQAVGRMQILYGARAPEQMLFRVDIPAWRAQPDTDVRLVVDDAPPGTAWEGKVGVVTDLFDHPSAAPFGQTALVCGPELMMRFVVHELLLRGMRPAQIYLSMERRMKCGVAHCGHCQLGPFYVCKDGPVFSYSQLRGLPDMLL